MLSAKLVSALTTSTYLDLRTYWSIACTDTITSSISYSTESSSLTKQVFPDTSFSSILVLRSGYLMLPAVADNRLQHCHRQVPCANIADDIHHRAGTAAPFQCLLMSVVLLHLLKFWHLTSYTIKSLFHRSIISFKHFRSFRHVEFIWPIQKLS